MYKIIRIDQEKIILGNTEDNSLKKMPLESGYEGAQVGDFVEIFSDESSTYIVKREVSSKPAFTISSESLKLDSVDVSGVIPSVMKFIEKIIDYSKEKQTYIYTAIYIGVLVTIVFITTVLLNEQIATALSNALEASFLNETFSISPLIVLGNALLGGIVITMNDGGFLGGTEISMTFTISLAILLFSLTTISLSLYAVKRFILAQNPTISSLEITTRLVGIAIIGQMILGLFLAFYTQAMSEFISLKLNVIPLLFKGGLMVTLLAIMIGIGREANNKENNLTILTVFKQKLILFFTIGLIGALYSFMQTTWDSLMLAGNYSAWFIAQSFGVDITMSSSENSTKLIDSIPNFTPMLVIMAILILLVTIIDLDDIKQRFKDLSVLTFSLLYSAGLIVLIGFINWFANASMSGSIFGVQQSMSMGINVFALIIPYIVFVLASFLRLNFHDQLTFLDSVKEKYYQGMKLIKLM